MSFSPVSASSNIVKKYKRYLGTMFGISNLDYYSQFNKELERENILSSGPYIDVTDTFVKGKT